MHCSENLQYWLSLTMRFSAAYFRVYSLVGQKSCEMCLWLGKWALIASAKWILATKWSIPPNLFHAKLGRWCSPYRKHWTELEKWTKVSFLSPQIVRSLIFTWRSCARRLAMFQQRRCCVCSNSWDLTSFEHSGSSVRRRSLLFVMSATWAWQWQAVLLARCSD